MRSHLPPSRRLFPLGLALGLSLLVAGCGGGGGSPPLREPNVSVPFSASNFAGDAINNPRLPLIPGARYVFQGQVADGFERVETDVTSVTKTILGVVCVEVHDVSFLDGQLAEDTLDWYAQDGAGNVWYFGEDAKKISNGMVVSTEGSWEGGVAGALPGIVMFAAPAVGQVYQQEDAPGVAEDRAATMSINDSVTTPYGPFTGCLRSEEFSPLMPGALATKYYAQGVGIVLEVDEDGFRIELISVQ